jgi:hypothetical protein
MQLALCFHIRSAGPTPSHCKRTSEHRSYVITVHHMALPIQIFGLLCQIILFPPLPGSGKLGLFPKNLKRSAATTHFHTGANDLKKNSWISHVTNCRSTLRQSILPSPSKSHLWLYQIPQKPIQRPSGEVTKLHCIFILQPVELVKETHGPRQIPLQLRTNELLSLKCWSITEGMRDLNQIFPPSQRHAARSTSEKKRLQTATSIAEAKKPFVPIFKVGDPKGFRLFSGPH